MIKNVPTRLVWMDILNIVSCLAVLIIHLGNAPLFVPRVNMDFSFLWACMIDSFMYFPIQAFLMMSGANILGGKDLAPGCDYKIFYLKRFKRIVVPFLLWSAFYIAINTGMESVSSFDKAATFFLESRFNLTFWFFGPLFAFYLCAPFIRRCIDSSSEKEFKMYLLFGFIFCVAIPALLRVSGVELKASKYVFPFAGSLVFYPVLGYVLNERNIGQRNRYILYLSGILAAFIHFGELYCGLVYWGLPVSAIQNIANPTPVILGCAVFVWFKNHDWKRLVRFVSARTLQRMASCTFGIYFIHAIFIGVSNKFGLPFHSPYYGVFITYPILLVFVLLMKKIPVVRILFQ